MRASEGERGKVKGETDPLWGKTLQGGFLGLKQFLFRRDFLAVGEIELEEDSLCRGICLGFFVPLPRAREGSVLG